MNPVFEDYQKIVSRLKEVLQKPKNDINRDSAIKRFELCFDLAWKSIKVYARQEGIECYSPRACFREAFQLGLIENDERWLTMIDDRNKSVHLYKEEYADQIYGRLSKYLELFQQLLAKLISKR